MSVCRLGSAEDRIAAGNSIGATLALAALTLAGAVGMGRLFAGSDHLLPLMAAAVVAHAVMFTGRRIGAPLALSAVVAMAAVALAGVWLLLMGTTTFAIPGPGTLEAVRRALADAWSEFGDVVAPAPPTDGFLLAAMVGVGATAVLADWAAFGMRVLFEAVVPSFTLFVFTATLGDSGGRSLMVSLYVGTLLAFLVVHRAGLESEGTSWFASRARGGARALLKGAAWLGLVAVVAAVVVGPRLPGASAGAVLAWRDSDRSGGNGRRTTVSPLVDIRGRLVDQSATEVFTVKADKKAYWRLTSLDTFDGQIWSSDRSYEQIGRRVPSAGSGRAPAHAVAQEFTIRSLSSIWLPAAYRPVRVEGIGHVSYNADLGSLITAEDTTDGFTYRVVSAVPDLTGDDLEGGGPPLADRRRFVALPAVAARVRREAQVAAGAARTPYEKALALQRYFRQGFVYDLNARPGHDERALENFLFTTRRGYCEQFAGAYAVLARSIGLPTRVAVGFTPGEPDAKGTYHVRGLNAHAWPEVYLAGSGWVAFEPTPGRGAPGAEAYTGVPEAQAAPQQPGVATTAVPTTAVTADDPSTPSTTAAPAGPAGGATSAGARGLWRHPAVVVLLGLVTLLVLVLPAVPLAKHVRRGRRRAHAVTPADRVWVAWTEAAGAVARAGAPRRPAETLDEHAVRAGTGAALPSPAAAALAMLARDAAAASYSGAPLEQEAAERARSSADTVVAAVHDMATRRRRMAWILDPRPLLPSAPAGRTGPSRRRARRRARTRT